MEPFLPGAAVSRCAALHCAVLLVAKTFSEVHQQSSANDPVFELVARNPRGFYHLSLALCPNSVSLDQKILCLKLLLCRCFSYLMNAKTNNKIYWHHVTDG